MPKIPQATKERAAKLRAAIDKYRYEYHVLDTEGIPIEALDALKHELKLLEEAYPELITPDSPTQRVAGEPLKEFSKVKHRERMLSLEDIFSPDEYHAWIKRLEKLSGDTSPECFGEVKYDGLAIALIYERGILR